MNHCVMLDAVTTLGQEILNTFGSDCDQIGKMLAAIFPKK